jgi:hypothetical protein
MNDLIWVWGFQCVMCAIFAGTIGNAKGRAGAGYFFLGLLFGFLGLIFAAGMPTREGAALEAKRDADEFERTRLVWEQARLERERIAHEKKQARLEKKQAKRG